MQLCLMFTSVYCLCDVITRESYRYIMATPIVFLGVFVSIVLTKANTLLDSDKCKPKQRHVLYPSDNLRFKTIGEQ